MSQPFKYARKKLGQHFLVDRNVVGRIITAADVKDGEEVIEIGPGRGALTGDLLDAGARLTAIELDESLARSLVRDFGGRGLLEVRSEDAVRVSYTALSQEKGSRFKVVSNLPYNISGPIVARFVEERAAFTEFIIMVQKEVAERFTGRPGTKEYGALSVLIQTYMDAKLLFNVHPGSFKPRPKVESSVVSLRVLEEPRVEVGDERFYRSVVRASFVHRRKTLINSLKTLPLPTDEMRGVLDSLSIDPKRRGETLTLEEFSCLARGLAPLRTLDLSGDESGNT